METSRLLIGGFLHKILDVGSPMALAGPERLPVSGYRLCSLRGPLNPEPLFPFPSSHPLYLALFIPFRVPAPKYTTSLPIAHTRARTRTISPSCSHIRRQNTSNPVLLNILPIFLNNIAHLKAIVPNVCPYVIHVVVTKFAWTR
jgi:hypothetical protein